MAEGGPDLTDLQEAILYCKRENPGYSNREIADEVGCSDSHVSQTLSDYDTATLQQLNHEPTQPEAIDRSSDPDEVVKSGMESILGGVESVGSSAPFPFNVALSIVYLALQLTLTLLWFTFKLTWAMLWIMWQMIAAIVKPFIDAS